jgi:hypothetical protein
VYNNQYVSGYRGDGEARQVIRDLPDQYTSPTSVSYSQGNTVAVQY